MPPRPPPSPPLLTVLCSFAALLAVWVSLAVDQLARGAAGALLGAPVREVTIAAGDHYLLAVRHAPLAAVGPWSSALVVGVGTAAVIGGALAAHATSLALRSPGWLRGFALAWIVVAMLWVPESLLAAALRGGRGPAAELYQRLGNPQAGRWTAVALALAVLILAAGPLAARAVRVGGAWMRSDAPMFRRRLVRVVAGWPGAVASLALGIGAGWFSSPWLLAFPAVAFAALVLRTR